MKKLLILPLVPILLLFSGCARKAQAQDATFRIAATTYPVYLFTAMLAKDVEGVAVTAVVNQPVSYLHNYSLSAADIQALEGTDALVVNGEGLEPFLPDIQAAYPDLPVIDASRGITFFFVTENGNDPHYWLDPSRAVGALNFIYGELAALDPDHARAYLENLCVCTEGLSALHDELHDKLSELECRDLVTFQDGFSHFAEAFGLKILHSVKDAGGSKVSEMELTEIAVLVREHELPAVFCAENGPDDAANAVALETGVNVGRLSLFLSGDTQTDDPYGVYAAALTANADALLEAMR